MYLVLKLTHISAVTLSFCGFVARGLAVLRGASWVRTPAARRLPHLIDTVLLLSALGMLWVIRLSPWAVPWLRAKIIGVILYIALGTLALRPVPDNQRERPRTVRLAAWLAALVVFGYIVSVALTKDARGVLTVVANATGPK